MKSIFQVMVQLFIKRNETGALTPAKELDMTREEVKKALVDFFKDNEVEELEDNTSRIKIGEGVINRVFYLDANCLVFLFYIKTDYSLMSNTITNSFLYSQIKQVKKIKNDVRFLLEDGTLISIEF